MSVALFLRKRRVLLAIFLFSLTYFILATYSQLKNRVVEEEDIVAPVRIEEILKTVKPFHPTPPRGELPKQDIVDHKTEKKPVDSAVGPQVNSSASSTYKCRNSVQGRSIIADENGYVCDLFDLQSNGCCRVEAESSKRYHCDSCTPSGCCSQYENCVSCCLHPQKVYLLRKVLEKKGNNVNRVYSLVNDHFDLCLTLCRTSSESVRHENSYIDSYMKYCYGSTKIRVDAPIAPSPSVNKSRPLISRFQ